MKQKIKFYKNNHYIYSKNEIKIINFFIELYKNKKDGNKPTFSNCRFWLSDLIRCQYDGLFDALISDADVFVMHKLFNYIATWHSTKAFADDEAPVKYIKLWNLLDNQEVIEFEGAINE